MHRAAFILALVLSSPSWADYGWIPEYQHLHITTGLDIYSTSQNYADDSFLDAPRIGGQTITFGDTRLWLKPEYGIAEDWSAGLLFGYTRSTATSDGTDAVLASGAGLMDLWVNAKWRVSKKPLWTIEAYFKLPMGVASPSATDEIVNGDGNLDVGVRAHYGYQTGMFYFSGTPGILGRLGGYSTAITADAAVQMFIQRAYAKFFINSQFALGADALAPSTVAGGQTLAGSAGSYARLAASPTMIVAGGAVGVLITKNFRLDGGVTKVVWGQRCPNYISFNINLLSIFDLTTPDYRPKVKEVPFENTPTEF